MMDDPRAITFIGTTDFRNSNIPFGIRAKDRLRHTYIIGSTGVGKSFLIENLLIQDIQNGNGVALLDPHGTTAEKILKFIPESRIKDVVYFAPHDLDFPVGFNPLEDPGRDYRSQVADGLLTAFKKIWVDAFSGRMEYIFSNVLLALLEYPGSTLLSVNRMMSDIKFREKVVANVKDPSVKSVWVDEFMKWEDRFAREAFSSIQNKVGQFTANPMIRNILGQPKSTLDFREMMDTRKIFIANLSKGRVGEQNAPLIGAMLITKIYLAAMSRADKSEYEMNFLPPFYLYVDEFQNFANDSFENILSESRKYKLGLIVAHQYVAQMPEKIQDAVFGNVGTKIVFRTQKPEDAEIFEKVFTPVFTATDIMNLGLAQIYLSLLIDGVIATPFSARTIRQAPPPPITFEKEIIQASRERYTRTRDDVEAEIAQWFTTSNPVDEKKSNVQKSQQSSDSNNTRAKEHAEYLEQKKKEIEAKGGVWLAPDEYKAAKEAGTLDDLIKEKRAEQKKSKQSNNNDFQSPVDKPSHPNSFTIDTRVRDDERSPRRKKDKKSENRSDRGNTMSYTSESQNNRQEGNSQKHKNASSDETKSSLKSLLNTVLKDEGNTKPKQEPKSSDKPERSQPKEHSQHDNQISNNQDKNQQHKSKNTQGSQEDRKNNQSTITSSQKEVNKDTREQNKPESNNQSQIIPTTQQSPLNDKDYDKNSDSPQNNKSTHNNQTVFTAPFSANTDVSKRWTEIDPKDLAKALGLSL